MSPSPLLSSSCGGPPHGRPSRSLSVQNAGPAARHAHARTSAWPRERGSEGAHWVQSEQSGFSQGTGHTDLCRSRKRTGPCGRRRPVFRANGHLMNDAGEGRGGLSDRRLHGANFAGIAERRKRKSRRAPAVPQTRPRGPPGSNFAVSMCASLPGDVTVIHHRHLLGPSLLKTGLTETVNPV